MAVEAQVLPPRYADPRRIGRGGMGDIYVAEDRQLGRKVAIKVLAERFASDASVRYRFTREALTAARLSGHSRIVTIFDVGEWNGRPFIVMEFLPGGTVAERARRGEVPPGQALGWLKQAAEALDAAHEAGIVHRDVKPANLLFDSRNELHVADFGIARVLDETTGGMTAPGTILGTSGYLSPEQARGEEATAASDIYSLAVVAYELLTGSRPFQRGTATAEAAAHIHERVPPASERAPGLPPEMDEVFARALAKDPAERHATAGELIEDLCTALAADDQPTEMFAAPAARTVPLDRRPPVTPVPARARGRWLIPALLAVALVGGGLAAAAAFTGDGDRGAEPRTSVRIRTVVSTAPGETVERVITQTVTTPAAVEEEDDVASPPPSPTPVSPTPPAGADGHSLNDRGYALQQQGRYAEALPLLQQAVPALRGTYTPQDRYEAYANYNLGYTLLQLGRCDEALPYLNRSEQLQGHRTEIDAARAAAEECATRGGRGRGNPNED